MGESNGNRQAGQNQSVQKAGSEGNGKKTGNLLKEQAAECDKIKAADIKGILTAYEFMVSEGLYEIEFESDIGRIYIRRASNKEVARTGNLQDFESIKSNSGSTCADTEEIKGTISITSPLSGVFYSAAKPGLPPFVNAGDTVKEGSILCIIEAMKVMNEIKSDSSYKIIKTFAVNGKSVSAGEVLFLVKAV